MKFLQRVTGKLTVLDAAALDIPEIPEALCSWVSPLVLHALASDYCLKLSQRTDHPVSSRRYMGMVNF